MKKKIIILIIILLIVTFSLLVFCTITILERDIIKNPDVDVIIKNFSYFKAQYGNGTTICIEINFINNENITILDIFYPNIITDQGRELRCQIIGYGEIPPFGNVNITICTYDDGFLANPLNINEKPITLTYRYKIEGIRQPPFTSVNLQDLQ